MTTTNPQLFNSIMIESIATRLLAHYAPTLDAFMQTANDCDLTAHELIDSIIDSCIDHDLDDDIANLDDLYRDIDSLDLMHDEFASFDLFELIAHRIDS